MTETHQTHSLFHEEVVAGLSKTQKSLPCKYLYDERGSKLFDQICELDEYYLTRTELSIMEANAPEIARQIGPGAMLIELGSGSSVKTRYLLENLESPAAYVPIDISEEHLANSAGELRAAFPTIEILPIATDFTKEFRLPKSKIKPSHAAVYFPGSTIGNFREEQARDLLSRIATTIGKDGGLIIGLDLQKKPSLIDAAYNDAAGVTAEFNLNLLQHINNELDADFDLDQFEHHAKYVPDKGRVEIGLVSQTDQIVSIGDDQFQFETGQYIHTEFSHKYTIEGFSQMAAESGFAIHHSWTDEQQMFAVLHFVIE